MLEEYPQGEDEITICAFCRTRGKNQHKYNGKLICGNCIPDVTGVIIDSEIQVKRESQPPVSKDFPKNLVCIEGRVYELSQREVGNCKHNKAKKIEDTWGLEMNFCFECGTRLRRRKKDSKLKAAEGAKDETEQ